MQSCFAATQLLIFVFFFFSSSVSCQVQAALVSQDAATREAFGLGRFDAHEPAAAAALARFHDFYGGEGVALCDLGRFVDASRPFFTGAWAGARVGWWLEGRVWVGGGLNDSATAKRRGARSRGHDQNAAPARRLSGYAEGSLGLSGGGGGRGQPGAEEHKGGEDEAVTEAALEELPPATAAGTWVELELVSAWNLRPADANGLADPLAIVTVAAVPQRPSFFFLFDF